MITRNMVKFMTAFESKMAHESIEETIEEMCHTNSVESYNSFGYEI